VAGAASRSCSRAVDGALGGAVWSVAGVVAAAGVVTPAGGALEDDGAAKPSTPKLAAPAMTAETKLTEIALAAATAVRLCIAMPFRAPAVPGRCSCRIQDNRAAMKVRAV
jgi:hypothetical protein